MQLSKQLLLLFTMISLGLQAQNLGVKLADGTSPNTTLDINGAVSFREGTALTLTNGVNSDITLSEYSFLRVTGPTAAFSITGFSGGNDGRVLTIMNNTSQVMTLTHQSTSSSANQINTGGTNTTIAASGIATLYYNTNLSKWVVTAVTGATPNFTTINIGNYSDSMIVINNGVPGRVPPREYIETYAWGLDGNAGTVDGTHFLGTMDNIPLSMRVNNQKAGRIDHLKSNAFYGYLSGNSNTTGGSNTAIGQDAMRSVTTGSYNVAVGFDAMLNATGSNNVAIGPGALESGSSDATIAIGYGALQSTTTGSGNIAIGNLAGSATTSGSSNTAVGYSSLINNTTGSDNTAFGNSTLLGNSTGNLNTTVGKWAMYGNTTGTNNSSLGAFSLHSNATGSGNVAIGSNSLYTTNGTGNTGLGYGVGSRLSSGNYNLLLGREAGDYMTTGSSNVVLGYQSGSLVTTGSNNTLLGTGANVTAGGGAFTNATAIGYNAIVGASNSLVLGSTGANAVNIGINTTTPQYKLDIDARTGSAGNPLRLLGLNAGATSDSIMTASSGIIRRMAMNNLAWTLTGNSGTVDGTNFIGTTDNIPLSIRVNNQKAGRIDPILNNAFWGYQAGNAVTSGTNNVAIGSTALSTMTTGNENIAIGGQSGLSNTTGVRNVSIGYQSARNGTHSNSVMIGYQAGLQNAASNNVFIGSLSGPLTSTGSDNIGMGYYTLFNNTTGKNNIGIGSFALSTTSGAWGNTAIGHMSSTSIQTGQANTALGDSSLMNNVLGSNNTHVGYRAGLWTTGSNNIAIGSNATLPVSTADNQLALGNWLYGKNSFLGINTIDPQYKLDIDAKTGSTGNPLRLQGLQAGALTDSIVSSNGGVLRRLSIAQITGGGFWSTTGNSGTVDGTNFIGTTDNIPLSIRVNNFKAGRIDHLNYNAFFGFMAGNANTGTRNSFFGHQAGSLNTTGNYNTGLGYGAMGTNTTASNNVSIGAGSMESNTTGYDNVAIGRHSMRKNITSYHNTAVGTYSLQENLGGYGNTALGWSALNQTTTGYLNTATGAQALIYNITGYENVASGFQSLYFNTAGNRNTSIGTYAMFKNETGDNNVALGSLALSSNITGWGNTALGYRAAFSSVNGQSNVAIGDSALYNNTVSNNTAIGYRAGMLNTTGANNTYLGYLAEASANNLSNATAIGANAVVGASNSLVLGGTGANVVNVGIGTTTPGATLEVKSSTALSTGVGVKFRSSTLDSVLTLGNDANFKFRNNSAYDFGTDVNNFIAGYTLSSAGFRTFTPTYGRGFFGVESLLAAGGTTAAANYYGFRGQLIEESTHSTALNETYAGIFNFKKKGSGNYTLHQNMISNIILDGGSGTFTNAHAVVGQLTMGTGTANVTAANLFQANLGDWASGYSGTISNLRGLYINYLGHARVQNAYGIFMEDVTGATSSNYAIYTKAGRVRLGDVPTATDADVVTIDGSGNLTKRSIYSSSWNLSGNSGTNPSSNFVGTTDAQDLVLRTNNVEAVRVTSAGNMLVGALTPGETTGIALVNQSSNDQKDDITTTTYNSTTTPAFVIFKARGTAAAPTSLANSENIGGFNANGYTGSAFTPLTAISTITASDFTTSQGAELAFSTARSGSNTERVRINSNGNVGVATNSPNTSLDVNGGLTTRPGSTVSLTADNQAVTVGNSSFIVLSSNNATSTNRTFTLSNGLQNGQVLTILLTTNNAELADSGNCALASTFAMNSNDTISLIWNGSTWYETSRSVN